MMSDNQQIHSEQILSRHAEGEGDYWRVHSLLIETYALTPPGFNWDIRRWEGMRFYDVDPSLDPDWGERVQLWETAAGRLVGAVHGERESGAYLQLHPHYRQIEAEMIAWAEEHLAVPSQEDQRFQKKFGT